MLFGLWWFYEVRADLRAARELAEQLLDMARRRDDPADLVQAHRAMGHTLLWLGEFGPALAHFERAIALYDPRQHRSLALHLRTGARGARPRLRVARLWYLGYPDRARRPCARRSPWRGRWPTPSAWPSPWITAPGCHHYRREAAETREAAEEDVGFSGEQGFPFFLAQGTILRGWALAEQGRDAEGMAEMRRAWPPTRRRGRC